ncbi:MAG TPA: 30S ribosomal protein S2 [Acidimicrobiia bacterium]|nr:30S ribosomal protein S2 [Acidimicrobiia bacterium]
MAAVTIKQLLEAGVHFGHQTRRWNPKMRPYIFGERNGIHIIDLRQTLVQIELAAEYLRNLAANGGTVLFVGTKKQAQGPVAEAAQRAGMPYVNFRWLGGMLTNFTTIQKRIFYMKELERMESSGEINALSKRERLSIRRELDKLQQTLGGVREMTRVPEAIFIVDVNTEHTAVKEAKRLGITTLALVDSNCDPDFIDFVIAGNDDAIRAASTVAGALAEAAREGRELAGKKTVPAKGEKPQADDAPMKAATPAPAPVAPAPAEAAPPEPATEPEPPAAVEAEVPAVDAPTLDEPATAGDTGQEIVTNG